MFEYIEELLYLIETDEHLEDTIEDWVDSFDETDEVEEY